MPDVLLRVDVLTRGFLVSVYLVAGLLALGLSLRRRPGWPRRASWSAGMGAAAGTLALWLVERPFNLIGTSLLWPARWSIVGLFALWGLAAANLTRSLLGRKVFAVSASVLLLVCAGLVVNGQYGLNPTLGAIIGRATERGIALPPRSGGTDAFGKGGAGSRLADSWVAPSGMPAHGRTGVTTIPGTVSGFVARAAGIYLPPAALTAAPPPLPFLLLMMGQPGNPDPSYIATVLDRYAGQHAGLAPIVVVADQLGTPWTDTLCLDTPTFGRVETYINTDVTAWARGHLNIRTDRSQWTVAGYSNGGHCAISFAAKHPNLWGNVLDISGEEYPGAEHAPRTLTSVFHGDQAAYDAQRPTAVLDRHHYRDTLAIFTVGSDDTTFMPGVKRVISSAARAGMTTRYSELYRAGHLMGALVGGLDHGIALLYPRLGLTLHRRMTASSSDQLRDPGGK